MARVPGSGDGDSDLSRDVYIGLLHLFLLPPVVRPRAHIKYNSGKVSKCTQVTFYDFLNVFL